MTFEEREALRRAIDAATRERLADERERRTKRSGPKPRLDDSEAVDAVERVLADGVARSINALRHEVGIHRKPTVRALRVLVALDIVEEIPGDRSGWVAYRLKAEARRAA